MILGAAQLGLPYGIANQRGALTDQQAQDLLEAAWEAGFRRFDTAADYGESEQRLGRFARSSAEVKRNIRLVTKLPADTPPDTGAILRVIDASRRRLGVDELDGLLIHETRPYFQQRAPFRDAFLEALDHGWVRRAGLSVYGGGEIRQVADREEVTLVQLPCSILDQRLVRGGELHLLKRRDVEIHARSLFLQGVLLMPAERLPQHLAPLMPFIQKIEDLADELDVSQKELALAYGLSVAEIDDLVVGAETVEQVQELGRLVNQLEPLADSLRRRDLSHIPPEDDTLLNPSNWSRS